MSMMDSMKMIWMAMVGVDNFQVFADKIDFHLKTFALAVNEPASFH